jgi:nucleoside-diphosphate-sugar epimerase
MSRVLVTGAGGFVGRAVLPALRAAGFEPVAASRNPQDDRLPGGVEVRRAPSLGPDADWSAALAGCQAVVHLAARVHVMRDAAADPLAEFRAANARGTRRLAEQAAAAGVRRFVFASSVKAMGETTAERPLVESDPPAPADPYGLSKLEAERSLAEVAATGGLEPVVLRLPLVYGPGVKGNFLSLLRLCKTAPPLPLGSVANRRSLLYVGNLADAVIRCLAIPAAAGRTFLLSDGEDLSTPELVRRLAAALGRPARLLPCPPGLLRLAAVALGRRAAAARLLDSLAVDGGEIRRTLGWTPPFSVAEGLAATARWFAGH